MFSEQSWYEAWSVERARAFLQDLWTTPHALGGVALVEDEVGGFILGYSETRGEGEHFYLAEMCVLASMQGRGIGKGLVVWLEATLRAQDVTKIYLLTARSGAAEAFYHACSFYTSEKMVMLGKTL